MTNLRSSEAFSTLTQPWIELLTGTLWNAVSSTLAPYTQPGWDGEGAEPITESSVTEVRAFILALPVGTFTPNVSVGYDGSIGLAWADSRINLFAHFPPDGIVDFTFRLHRFGWEHYKQLSANDPEIAEELRPTFSYISNFVSFTNVTVTINTYYQGAETLVVNQPRQAARTLPAKPRALPH